MITAHSSTFSSDRSVPRYRSYCIAVLAAFAAAALAAHAISVIATARLYFFYPGVSNRVVDVRLFPEAVRFTIIDDFLRTRMAQARGRPVAIIGDSQFYGATQHWSETFPALIAAKFPAIFPVNVSVTDGRFDDSMQIANAAADKGVRAIVYNVNPAHFSILQKPEVRRLTSDRVLLPSFLAKLSTRSTIEAALNAPSGLQEFRYRSEQDRYTFDLSAGQIEKYTNVLAALAHLELPVVVVMSPHATSEFAELGYDLDAFQRMVDLLMEKCESHKLVCIDMTAAFDRSHFKDIIHLNLKGHRAMAARLGPLIASLR